jgi:ATP-dependent helicase Lhr and Lhr-like helicase
MSDWPPTEPTGPGTSAVLDSFHPAVRAWFEGRFPGGPTEPQRAAWPLVAEGRDVLVASPTGTGKTLTGFLVAIDAAYRRRLEQPEAERLPEVVYVSPLRALAVDVHENLQVPLEGIAEAARDAGMAPPDLTVAVRTGDTSSSERAAMRRRPPDLLVTTPESLYLLLTAPSSRAWLRRVRTVIVDEVHTLARDKRGAHLALSLERLAAVAEESGGRLQRIGLSATQRPLDVVARLLCGSGPDRPVPAVVDCGHLRRLDVDIELPPSELEAVASHTQFEQVIDRLADLVRAHRTTLIFVNTRRMSERLAHLPGERLEPDESVGGHLQVAAHHGSLSSARRRTVEGRLRAGDLRALVATASLELGIDVGPVDLVCQIGSPRAIATFLQRVGRANHQLGGVPRGRLFPMTRDELVESTALLAAVRHERLDVLRPVVAPLDVLAQQLVAEVAAAEERSEDELYAMARRSAPYADLERAAFDEVVDLVSHGVATGRGRRGAHLHRDGVHGRLRARRGARLAAMTGGGAIPETGDYRVVVDPDGATVGSVHEDFAVEAAVGDVFLLGTHSWRVRKVENGTVRVHDAGDAAPTVPFWLGEAPARTAELSEEVGALRQLVDDQLDGAPDVGPAERAVREWSGVGAPVAEQVVAYLAAARRALGTLPTRRRIVVERFFDESEGMQLVVHSPYGGGVNRALGLALRKRFCVTFDFELQAAADDDTVLVSLGPQHSFPLAQVPGMVRSDKAVEVLTQAVLAHPMVQARWRWNCTRALVVPRSRGGQRRPINLLRMDADDVLAAAWPTLAACQDNAPPGPVAVPDHVLVRQTIDDCLHEALDADGLVEFLRAVESGEIEAHLVESPEPSPLAHGILSGRPYTFLDGAPLEERRSRAVPLPRGLDPAASVLGVGAGELGPLDEAAAREVLESVRPRPRDRDELHDLLLSLVVARPVPEWQAMMDDLVSDGRARDADGQWVATERLVQAASLDDDDEAVAECVRGHLELAGPVRVEELVGEDPLPPGAPCGAPIRPSRARVGLARLEAEGVAIALPDGRWCARHLLARLHGASRRRRRQRVEPASVTQLVDFLCRWQHVTPGTRLEGRAGLLQVVEQLQGVEIAAGEWEHSVLPARLQSYDPRWLDELCLSGEVAWGRLTPRPDRSDRPADPAQPTPAAAAGAPEPVGPDGGPPETVAAGPALGSRRGTATPSPATPLAIVVREDLPWLLQAVRLDEPPSAPLAGAAADVLVALSQGGACFRSELGARSGRLPVEVDEGLWDLVARGIATADAYSAVRSLLSAKARWGARQRARRGIRPGAARRSPVGSGLGEGRWALLPAPGEGGYALDDEETIAESVAWQLLQRWGVVLWELWCRESFRIPWRHVVRALRRFEARGLVVGGRLVAGLSGEQFALPDAFALLSDVRRGRGEAEEVSVAGADPLNLTGSLLPVPRVPAVRHRRVRYRGGVVLEAEGDTRPLARGVS